MTNKCLMIYCRNFLIQAKLLVKPPTVATVGVGGFFLLVVASNIPWGKIWGKKKEEEEEDDEQNEAGDDDDCVNEDDKHTKSD